MTDQYHLWIALSIFYSVCDKENHLMTFGTFHCVNNLFLLKNRPKNLGNLDLCTIFCNNF